jgi:hypothetical protein
MTTWRGAALTNLSFVSRSWLRCRTRQQLIRRALSGDPGGRAGGSGRLCLEDAVGQVTGDREGYNGNDDGPRTPLTIMTPPSVMTGDVAGQGMDRHRQVFDRHKRSERTDDDQDNYPNPFHAGED